MRFLLAFLFLFPAVAFAQPICAEHDELAKILTDRYSEVVVARGAAPDASGVLEVFVSPSGTWTIVVTGPGGSCAVIAGDGWERLSAPDHSTDQRL